MAHIYDFFNENGLFNTVGTDWVMYYDKHSRDFIALPAGSDSDKLIETPYREEFRRSVWKEFYRQLTSDELDLINSFDEPVGFFDFLHTSGLYGKYESANRTVAECILSTWQLNNGIVVNTN
jgi:hypothetical protein